MELIKTQSIKTSFSGIDVFTQALKVKHIIDMYYVAVRGVDTEEGSVQRLLSKRRIDGISNFILEGNGFFNSFIFNWTKDDTLPKFKEGKIEIPFIRDSMQVIDGQHRLAGLEKAIEEEPTIAEQEVMTSLVIGLKTNQAATIFLNINSEQKPVPKSLIYDLFGESVDDKLHAVNRATDIATELNTNEESPYYRAIKFPGTPRGVGIIDLSTVVSSMKKELEPDGKFTFYNLKSLEYQKRAVLHYFLALSKAYLDANMWNSKTKNPFFTNAGFTGAIEHFVANVLPKCSEKGSFEVKFIRDIMSLDRTNLLVREEIKNLDGKTQRKKVKEYLEYSMVSNLPSENEYKF